LKNGLIAAGEKILTRTAHALEHHPKHVTALVAAALLLGGGGAFAVASLGPDPSDLPVREVLEAVTPLPVREQLDALELHRFNLYRSEITRSSDSVDSLLARLGVDDPAAAAYLRTDNGFRTQILGRAGRTVTVEANDAQKLQKLVVRWTPNDDGTFRRLVIERGEQGFASRVETAPLVASTRMSGAAIRSSLFAAADDARIPDAVIGQIIEIFSGDIDFHRALRQGDRFSVVYEALEADGEPMKVGRILSVEFLNKGQTHTAMWFQEPGRAKGSYFSMDGKSLETSYLASPVKFSRVTSGFATRFHPILHEWKAHLGVDYGASIGTPVRTIGDGTVEFAGVQNGFGKVVIIRHNNTDETLYAHLSRLDVRAGQPVHQGDNVGAVGMTGWATGPHLHFEFRVNGVHQDPSVIAQHRQAATLSAQARPAFERAARSMRMQLEAAQGAAVARAE
jgi:murein DD-endopeptidase MepM/ murein hydrolase activator NlpD